jgi:hypothetical protein
MYCTLDKLSHVFADEWDTLRVRVGPDGADLVEELLGPGNDVFREHVRCELDQLRVLGQSSDLCVKESRSKSACAYMSWTYVHHDTCKGDRT